MSIVDHNKPYIEKKHNYLNQIKNPLIFFLMVDFEDLRGRVSVLELGYTKIYSLLSSVCIGILPDELMELKRRIEKGLAKLNEDFNERFNTYEEKLKENAERIESNMEEKYESLKDEMKGLFDRKSNDVVGSKTERIESNMGEGIESLKDEMKELFDRKSNDVVGSKTERIESNIGEGIESLKDEMKELFDRKSNDVVGSETEGNTASMENNMHNDNVSTMNSRDVKDDNCNVTDSLFTKDKKNGRIYVKVENKHVENIENEVIEKLVTSLAGSRTSFQECFFDCSKLIKVTFGSESLKVTDISEMFWGCRNLDEVDLTGFDTTRVTNMSGLFSMCSCLRKVNVSELKTDNAIIMSFMFNGCAKLESLDLTSFNTSKVTKMISMFKGCSKLTSLKVPNFKIKDGTDTDEIFYGCKENIEIEGPDCIKELRGNKGSKRTR